MKSASSKDRSRHLQWEALERLVGQVPRVIPIAGQPKISLYIEPEGRRFGARFVSKAKKPSIPDTLAELAIRWISVGGDQAIEMSTGDRALYQDFYQLICVVADRVQMEGVPPEVAIRRTLDWWGKLTRPKTKISPERQTGLLGELFFLKLVAEHLGWKVAIDSWKGCDVQEHDFTLPGADIEIKTTLSERRIHQITSLTQLLPKLGRPLFLVSAQITPVGEPDGTSLAELVSSVISEADAECPQSADLLRRQLRLFGWSDSDAGHYRERYVLRSEMQAIVVDEKFPAITPETLSQMGRQKLNRIDGVSYAVNVEGLGAAAASPKSLKQIFKKGKK